MDMKTEKWNGHEIRFVEKQPGEWWAVLGDITNALELIARDVKQRLSDDVVSNHIVQDTLGREQEMLIVNELGIYETVFESRKKEVKKFKRWVFEMLKKLREATGLEGFQVFRMMDKEHQKSAMNFLHRNLHDVGKSDYMQANEIANKVTSLKYGAPRTLNKGEMPPAWLPFRQEVLDEAVSLMAVNEKYKLRLGVNVQILKKYGLR